MKRIIYGVFFILIVSNSIAQQRSCGFDNYYNSQKKLGKVTDSQNLIENSYWITRENNMPFIIPVVVHVVYKTADQNISEAQIQSQIDALNRDYRKTNSDVANVPELFKSSIADCNIEFRLAKIAPDGSTTIGITRTATYQENFSTETDYVKFTNTGGHDIWDRNKYLNIWVCDIEGDLLGYSSFQVGAH